MPAVIRPALTALALGWLAFGPTDAAAQDLVSFDAQSVVVHGKATPSITFTVKVDGTFGFSVDCGMKKWSHPSEGLGAGSTVVLELPGVPKGAHDCAGAVEVESAEGAGVLDFRIPVVSLEDLGWSASMADIDIEARTAQPTATRPLKAAEAVITSVDRVELGRVQASLAEPTRPLFRWSPAATGSSEVLSITITAEDVHGYRSELTLSPWTYEIPHEDVVFATNAAEVTPDEAAKLEATWSDIEATYRKFGDYIDLNLYVAGYTDTVGDPGSNLALSRRRASAIAQWFKARFAQAGLPSRVYSQGFGESVLAVKTPDGTDEARNRRALYILAASPPAPSEAIPKSNWKAE
jgi:outer membrane protein OmpA-like peptidoglycan-associated protein